jgi:preprotein translocase SecE subunit
VLRGAFDFLQIPGNIALHRPEGRFLEARKNKNMSRLTDYLKDTRAELEHVSWPTQKQTIIYTALVIAISLLVAAFIGVFDFFFTKGVNLFIQ